MKSFLYILLCCLGSLSFAQKPTIDSLADRLTHQLVDTDRVYTLIDLGTILLMNNPDSTFLLVNQAKELSIEKNYLKGQARAHNVLAQYWYVKGDYNNSIDHFNDMVSIYEKVDNKMGVVQASSNIGIIYYEQANYNKALEYYFKALKGSEALKSMAGMAINYGNIGLVYSDEGDVDKALEYYLKALAIDEERRNKHDIATDLANIGIVHFEKKDYPQSLKYYFRALSLAEELNDKLTEVNILASIGQTIYAQSDADFNQDSSSEKNRLSTSLDYYLESLSLAEDLGNKSGIAFATGSIAAIYIDQNNYKKAKSNLRIALQLNTELSELDGIRDVEKLFSKLHEKLNEPVLALLHYKRFIVFRDSIKSEENTKEQTRTEMKYEYEKENLNKEQEEQRLARLLASQTARRDNIQYSVIFISLLLFFGAIAGIGFITVSPKVAEGLIFFSFLILFEFILVLADPYVDMYSGGAPGYKLLFNAVLAGLIFPLHGYFERIVKFKLVQNKTKL